MPRAAKRRQARNFRHLPLPRFAFALLAANGVLASANRTTSWNGRFPCLGQSPRTQRIPPKNQPSTHGDCSGIPSAERIGCGVLAATHPLSCGSGAYMRWKAAIPPTRQPFCSEIPEIAKTKNRPAETRQAVFLTLFPCARRAAHAHLSVQHSRTGKPQAVHTGGIVLPHREAAYTKAFAAG